MPVPLDNAVRERFRRQKTLDTRPELEVRRKLHASGARYRLNVLAEPDLRTKPDLLFRRAKVAVYVDGCFWHGCPIHFVPPKNNAAWWKTKIDVTRARDATNRRALTERGWEVISAWEHEDPRAIAERILRVLATRTPPLPS